MKYIIALYDLAQQAAMAECLRRHAFHQHYIIFVVSKPTTTIFLLNNFDLLVPPFDSKNFESIFFVSLKAFFLKSVE